MPPRVGSNRQEKTDCPLQKPPVRPKTSSNERKCRCKVLKIPPQKLALHPKVSHNERKCRCLRLTLPTWTPPAHLKRSRNEWKCRCWTPTRRTWEPPFRPNSRSNEWKCRCRELTTRQWEPLILLALSHNEGKYRCLRCKKLAPPTAESSLPSASATALPGGPTPNVPFPPVPPCAAMPHTTSCALLLQASAIPPETARLVRCHNPWPTEDVFFCPGDALPAFFTSIPALSSGPELWIAVHNHRPKPLQLHSGQNIGVLEVVMLADAPPMASQPGPPRRPSLPEHLSPIQQQQLNALFQEFSDIFSQGEDDLGSTPLLEHAIEIHGPPLRQPYRRQNPAVRREEMALVQQMEASTPTPPPQASVLY